MIVKNKPNVTNWSFEDGYRDKFSETEYPIRVFNANQGAALVLMISLFEEDLDYICKGPIQGFKVILHAPGQTIKATRHTFRVPLSEMAEISIKARLITTSEGLRSYKPFQRKCFYQSERKLRFFKYYSQYNCEAECLANFTHIECGCVKFSMTSKKLTFIFTRINSEFSTVTFIIVDLQGDKNTKICGAGSIKCYQEAEKKLLGEDVIDGLKDHIAKSFRYRCNCLPACTSIVYDAEIDRAKFDWRAAIKNYKMRPELSK